MKVVLVGRCYPLLGGSRLRKSGNQFSHRGITVLCYDPTQIGLPTEKNDYEWKNIPVLSWWTSPNGDYDPGNSSYGRTGWMSYPCNLPLYMDCECTSKSPEVLVANMIMNSDMLNNHSIEEYCRDYRYDLVPDIETSAKASHQKFINR